MASAMQLSIQCRGGRTELVVAGPALTRSGEDYAISYGINDDQPVQLAAAPPSFGTGVAFKGDVVRLLQSLPDEGEIRLSLVTPAGRRQEGHFLLGGLKSVRENAGHGLQMATAVPGHATDGHRTITGGTS